MAPVWRAGESNILCTSGASQLAERSLDELLRVGHESAWLANLGHGGSDEMRLNTLDVDTVWLELGAKRRRPLLEEGFAARIRGQEGSWEETTEGSHGEDETALARDHAGCEQLSDTERSHAVDHNDIVHLLLGCLGEGHRNAVAQTNVVDENADIQAICELLQAVVVGVLVLRKVHCERLGRDLRAIFRGNVRGERVELGLGAGNEDQVVALGCQGKCELLANAIRGTGDESPGTAGSKAAELKTLLAIVVVLGSMMKLTDLPGRTKRLNNTLIVLMIGAAKDTTPTNRKP